MLLIKTCYQNITNGRFNFIYLYRLIVNRRQLMVPKLRRAGPNLIIDLDKCLKQLYNKS